MKEFWMCLAFYMGGMATMAVLVIFTGKAGPTFKGRIRFSQRGKGNVQDTDIDSELKPILKRRNKRLRRKQKK
jgi:hypothetical protein